MIDPALIERIKSWFDDPKGQCYVASEALYYMAGGKTAGLIPKQASIWHPFPGQRPDEEGTVEVYRISHWWIEDRDGNIYDLTAEQFDFDFPYTKGVGRGFQTNMKGDTKELIEWLTTQ